jgi:hypothetical protein
MLALALALAAVVAAGALLGRRRRRARRPELSAGLDPMPAGVKHLATTVSDLSDLGLHLGARRGAALRQKPRLGALLDLRS